MAVRKRCDEQGCERAPRCDHPWWLDFKYKKKRHRMLLLGFSAPRMKPDEEPPSVAPSSLPHAPKVNDAHASKPLIVTAVTADAMRRARSITSVLARRPYPSTAP